MLYQRKSGDPNTSIGNSIINCVATSMLDIFRDSNKTSEAMMMGDDNIFMTNIKPVKEKIV